jgi:hypothetical protein
MAEKNEEERTEWIFCRDIKGRCSGISPTTKVLEKNPKTIKIHDKTIKGWMVKIVQEKSEGHVDIDFHHHSDE